MVPTVRFEAGESVMKDRFILYLLPFAMLSHHE